MPTTEGNHSAETSDSSEVVDRAVRRLDELASEAEVEGLYGKAGVEIEYEAGKPLWVRWWTTGTDR